MTMFRSLAASCFLTIFLLASAGQAAIDFSFTGSFTADDDVQLFNFTVGAESEVTLKTLSYAGGTNAVGDVIPAGGFDPILALFDSSLNFIGKNDDGLPPDVGTDPVTGQEFDTFLEVTLLAGDYTVAVSQYFNFFDGVFGDNISQGFTEEGNPNFTNTLGFGTAPMFNDVTGDARTGNWAFDILNVESADQVVIPESSTVVIWSLLATLGLVTGWRRTRRK